MNKFCYLTLAGEIRCRIKKRVRNAEAWGSIPHSSTMINPPPPESEDTLSGGFFVSGNGF